MTHRLSETSIRDFGGGWDVSDSDKALGSKFQPISDNIVRKTDGSFAIRPGTRLFSDLKNGTESVYAPAAHTVTTNAGTSGIVITKISHTNPCQITVGAGDIAKFRDKQTISIVGADTAHAAANGVHQIGNVGTPANTFTLIGVSTSSATVDQTSGATATTFGSGEIVINWPGHGIISGGHVNITTWSTSIGGFTAGDVLGYHGVHSIDGNNFSIYVRKLATSSATGTVTIGFTKDNHILGGRDIYGRYFKDHIIVFSDIGEIIAVSKDGSSIQIWSYDIATYPSGAQSPIEPWGPCRRISAEIVKGRLIAVNGATNDKPVEIVADAAGNVTCYYMLDDQIPAGNQSIPRADFVLAADRYMLLVSTDNGPTKVAISAKDAYMVFPNNPVPDDAVEIDLGMLTQSTDATILGANIIRSRVFIAFQDRSMLGELGIYDSSSRHDPDFKDNVAMLGTFSHAGTICLGNDIFCPAITGINSLSISQASGEYTPATISDLIHPVMLRHFARLTEDDRRYRTFAVWDANYRSYMLFAPKYSNVTYNLPDDPIIVSTTFQENGLIYVSWPSHVVDAGDYVTFGGLTGSPDGLIVAGYINQTFRVRAVVDQDTIAIEAPPYPTGLNYAFGGVNGFVLPKNDETPVYVYEYNNRLKIKRWTRFRGMNFDWGCVTQLSRLYFGKNGRIYRYGSASDKYSADLINDYSIDSWHSLTPYAVGDRVYDSGYTTTYICNVAHTSSGGSILTFAQDRAAHPSYWSPFVGFPINWELETSWTDFKDRLENKQIELVRFDTTGGSDFEFSIYTNSIREDFETLQLIPRRTTIFVGQDMPGYGAGTQPYGGGRNMRTEYLQGMPVEGKLFRLRFAGSSTKPLSISAATLYYHKKPTALT